jgi:hypothetical protein
MKFFEWQLGRAQSLLEVKNAKADKLTPKN